MRTAAARAVAVRSRQQLAVRLTARAAHTAAPVAARFAWSKLLAAATAGALALYVAKEASAEEKKAAPATAAGAVDYEAVRKDIAAILENPKYDDGSYGPVLIRLAWHASGTYSKVDHTGGSGGATMRFAPESAHGANAGLATARDLLEKIHAKYPGLSYGDLWTLAGCVAIESMGGPKIAWRPGRVDKDASAVTPDGRLPDAKQGQQHLRDIFYRMGFNDQEIVALTGAHAVGRCHPDRSGFEGPWTNSPTVFSNDYFVQLLNAKWTERKWNGPKQYEDESKKLMMLPADMSLLADPEFKKWVEKYAADEALWHADFAKAFKKLIELGVKFPEEAAKPAAAAAPVAAAKAVEGEKKPWYKFW